MIMLTDGLILTGTVGEEAFWKSWPHDYDASESRNVIGDVTIRLPL